MNRSTSDSNDQPSSAVRPILHHLNADSSWLLQLPNDPHSSQQGPNTGPQRTYYNILIDPWFVGSQTDVFAWFSRQWHAEPSHVKTVQEVCNLAQAMESKSHDSSALGNVPNNIDLVIVSHEFTDHCHQETLSQVEATVPVFAGREAAKLIRSWKHFHSVVDLVPASVQSARSSILPSFLNVLRLQKSGDALYLHAAVVIAFTSASSSTQECVVYTPHGIYPETAAMFRSVQPDLRPLCLIHGLHDVWLTLTQQINLGGHNGLRVYRELGCKYWTSTHDEDKTGRGLISYVLNRKLISVANALHQEASQSNTVANEEVLFQNVPNGGQLILV